MISGFSSSMIFKPCLIASSIGFMILNPSIGYFSNTPLFLKPWSVAPYKHFSHYGKKSSSSSLDPVSHPTPSHKPKTDSQQRYVSFLQNYKIPLVFAIGPAGTGKTYFACIQAIQQLKRGDVDKIVITRPLIAVEEEQLGFLPGSMVSKMDPWTRPIFDIFKDFYSSLEISNMIRDGIIEISPLAFMRGRTFHRSFVIADEMQNSSPNQMMMLTTRIGSSTKLVVTGDLQQSDLSVSSNGLSDFVLKYNYFIEHHQNHSFIDTIGFVYFDHSDVVRSPTVAYVLDIYNFSTGSSRSRSDSDSSSGSSRSSSADDYDIVSPPRPHFQFSSFSDSNKPGYIPLRDMGRPYPH
jgi:phosphate starvation-inducible PhoH-like protein